MSRSGRLPVARHESDGVRERRCDKEQDVPSPMQLRQQEKREEKLRNVREQVAEGTLVIRQMTAAERKRRSRSLQRQAGFLSAGQTTATRIPKPFACDLDELAIAKLKKVASQRKATIYQVLEQLIHEHL